MTGTLSLRTMIIDDEPLAVRRLARGLAEIEGIVLVGETSRASEAPALIDALDPDLLFIDVAMPRLDGFDVLDRLTVRPTRAVIFVTAHDHFAARAFDVDAVDYLLKPVSQPRLEDAVARARRFLGFDRTDQATPDRRESLWVWRGREHGRLWVDRIDWVEAQGNYVWIHTRDGGGLMRETLNALERRLASHDFIRTHRSVICRTSAIIGLSRQPTGAVHARLEDGTVVPVGRTYVAALKQLLDAR